MSLKEYKRRRNFSVTGEPSASRKRASSAAQPSFVVQQHHARRLHWDFRLEADGVLKSWAVTKEPSMETAVRRLAIETEDHPLEYGHFQGQIPAGEYGAGKVIIWDAGTFESEASVSEAMERGLIEVFLKGKKLKGRFVLVRTRNTGPKAQWLFFKAKPKIAKLRIPDVKSVVRKTPRKKTA